MNIAIFGTKNEAKYAQKQLNKDKNVCVKFFVDNNKKLWNTQIGAINVISVHELQHLYPMEIDAVIIAVRGTYSRVSIMNQLKNEHIDNIGIMKLSIYDYKEDFDVNNEFISKGVIWIRDIKKTVIPYLEMHVADSCNLNCSGCIHFSSLFEKDSITDFNQFKMDLMEVEKNCFIAHLRLLGGEPLINPMLSEFITFARKLLPQTDICVVTNGILIPNQNEELFKCMRENNVGFYISQYKPVVVIKDKIETVLKNNGVKYVFDGDEILEFKRNLSMSGTSNPNYSQKVCHSRGCRILMSGRIYKCPYEAFINKYINYYDIPCEIECGIDIYNMNMDWENLMLDLANKPVEMCKYCAEKSESFEWKVSIKPNSKEWLINEEVK